MLQSDRWSPGVAVHLDRSLGPFANEHATVASRFFAQTLRGKQPVMSPNPKPIPPVKQSLMSANTNPKP